MANHIDPIGPSGAPVDVPPAQTLDEITAVGQSLFQQAITFAESLFRTWNLYQVAIAVALLLLSVVLRRVFAPRLHEWMRAREGWPKWRLRWLLVVHKRLGGIFFVILMWTTVLVMREITWPSRSYLLGVIALLATAWLVVTFATRLIANPALRSVVRYGAWT